MGHVWTFSLLSNSPLLLNKKINLAHISHHYVYCDFKKSSLIKLSFKVRGLQSYVLSFSKVCARGKVGCIFFLTLKMAANIQWLFINSGRYAHPCLWAVCWHWWWGTDKVSRYHHHLQRRSDSFSLCWHPPALKILQDKKKKKKGR